jgi:hypothetical protein
MDVASREKYLQHREAFRRRAVESFHANDPSIAGFIAATGELVAASTLFLSGKDLSATTQRLYLGDLIVSFCRTHFIVLDLLQNCELVECATLIRKQIEVMARVRELSKPSPIDRLIGKTPNVKHLSDQLRRQYDEYSEIAHSATPAVMRLMGTIKRDGTTHTPVYPEFGSDAYVAMNHVGWLCAEFYSCTTTLYPEWFPQEAAPELEAYWGVVAAWLSRPQKRG